MFGVFEYAKRSQLEQEPPPRNLICQFIVSISILYNFSVYCQVFQSAETTEQKHVPSPLQRSRAGVVFSEDAGRLSEQSKLNAFARKDRRVSARAEKTVPAREAEGPAAGRPFFCILFFGRAKKSMNEKLGCLAQIAEKTKPRASYFLRKRRGGVGSFLRSRQHYRI